MKRLLIVFFLASWVHGVEIPTSRHFTPMLGQGYLSERQSLAGECLLGSVVLEGSPEASIAYSSSMSEQQLATELGFSVGAKARLGVMQTSASASFFNASKSDAFSISAIYTGTYFFKNRILKHPKAVLNLDNAERWREACGDEFVVQQALGAKLFFSIRIDFLSEEEKNAFASSFSLDTPFASASVSVQRAVEGLSKKTRVTINVLQIGGKVDKITQIFHGKDSHSAYHFVQCSSGQLTYCQKVLEQAVQYATDTQTGFPSQISPDFLVHPEIDGGPAILSSTTQPYRVANIFLEMTPELNSQIKLSRQLISKKYEAAYQQYTRVHRLLRDAIIRLSPKQRENFLRMETQLFDFLQHITESSLRCYQYPNQCSEAYSDLNMSLYEEQDFVVEPEIFSQYCDLGQSVLAPKSLSKTIKSMLKLARELESDLFVQRYENAPIDECHLAGLVYTRATELSFSGKVIEDLRPLVLFKQLRKLDLSDQNLRDLSSLSLLDQLELLDLRNGLPGSRCPLSELSRCRMADFRTNTSFVRLKKETTISRIAHTMTDLGSGKFLLAGGKGISGTEALQAEIWDHNTGEFRAIGNINGARYYHTATLLKDKTVLLLGGFGRQASQTADLFSSQTNTFISTRQRLNFPRAQHSATLLGDGRVLIVGGWSNQFGFATGVDATQTVEMYDSQTGTFKLVASMHTPRAAHRSILLQDNRVLVTGGYTPEGSLTSAEIYDLNSNTWRPVKGRMSRGRSEHAMVQLQDGRVLIVGGFTRKAEIFDSQTERFTELESQMSEIRGELEAVMLSDGKVAVFGGRTENRAEVDLDGESVPGCLASVEVYDPLSQLFTLLPKSMTAPRALFTATWVGQDRILLLGGMGGLAAYSAELFEYVPGV